MIGVCKPLDLNSTYAYLLFCHHFGDTCVIATGQGRIAGFVSAYRPPSAADVLFVWQVAVHPDARGNGLGNSMLRQLLSRPDLSDVRYLETTVSPSNEASRRMFHQLARSAETRCVERLLFGGEAFGGDSHEDEVLFRIGPFPG